MQFISKTRMEFEITEDGTLSIPLSDNSEILNQYKSFGQKTIQSSLDIEHSIKDIISNLLFQKKSNDPKFLKELFLDSSFCMFHTKIQILNRTLKHLNLLTGKKRNNIQNVLSKINKYRNMFAHGEFFCRNNLYYISYFEGELKEKELTEGFWNDIESNLFNGHELMDELFFNSFSFIAQEQEEVK